MRPNAEEIVRGVQAALMGQVMPELQTDYARTTATLMYVLLGIVANGMDGGYQRLLSENGALRELASRAADGRATPAALANELRTLAGTKPLEKLSELSSANSALAMALARVAMEEAPELASLRSEIIGWLRADAESRSLNLMGPRSDG